MKNFQKCKKRLATRVNISAWVGVLCRGTGLGPYEGGHIKIHPITGKVYVNTDCLGKGRDMILYLHKLLQINWE